MSNPTILDYYKYATLATAAYVRLGSLPLDGETFSREANDPAQADGRIPLVLGQRLFDPRFAIEGETQWNILRYYGSDVPAEVDPIAAADRTGFGATLFQFGANGEKVLAIRGTEVSAEWGVDLGGAGVGQIGILGLALTQVVSMANLIQRMKADPGAPVTQIRINASVFAPEQDHLTVAGVPPMYLWFSTYTGTGVGGIEPGETIKVTGHSLGGHLAYMAARLFPGVVDPQVHVYNAAGYNPTTADFIVFAGNIGLTLAAAAKAYLTLEFGPATAGVLPTANELTEPALSQLVQTLRGAGAMQGVPVVVNLNAEDIVSGDDWDIVASVVTGTQHYPTPIDVPVEANSHVIEPFMDALALQALFYQLSNNNLHLNDVTRLLEASSNELVRSEELLTEALFRLLLKDDKFINDQGQRVLDTLLLSDATGGPINKGVLAARAAFHDTVLRIGDAIKIVPGLQLFSLMDYSATDLANVSQGSEALGFRYALRALNPFVIVGDNAIYAPHNVNGELNLYDPVSRTSELTTEWITDRAAFLTWKNQYFTTDGVTLRGTLDENYLFENRDSAGKTDLSLTVVGNLAAGGNGGAAANPAKVVFGNMRTDVVTGGILSDRLYGDAGTDWLEGKANGDHLEGGKALDIYNYTAFSGLLGTGNDGADVIRDIDGLGVLRYVFNNNGTVSSTVIADASVRVSGLQWNSADGRFSFTRSQDDLNITINDGTNSSMTLKDFRDGDFGIRLWQPRPTPQYGETTNTVTGTDSDESLPGTPAADLIQSLAGDDSVDAGAGDDLVEGDAGADHLNGAAGNDRLFGGAGRDELDGGDGDDEAYGGADADIVEGRAGADLLAGGAGSDAVTGDEGDDEVYGGDPLTLSTALTLAETETASGLKGDWVDGGDGRDIVVGGSDNDQLMGGGGADIMVGGAGDDNLVGDAERALLQIDTWNVTRQVTQSGNSISYQLIYNASAQIVVSPDDAGDKLYGGAGVDWIWGGAGDDFIDGGSGNDVMFGEAGADVLIGGAGDDAIVGDNPGVVGTAEEGGDYLEGGAGNDTLQGNGGADVLIGGPGNDNLSGGLGKDIYVFGRGDGVEFVFDTDSASNSPDASVLVLADGIRKSEVKFRVGSLLVDLGNGDRIHFNGFDQVNPTATTPLGEIRFADGTSMSYGDILAQGFDIDGTAGNDNGQTGQPPMLVGTGVTDRIRGFGGNDVLFGLGGDDVLDGGAGADQITGGAGNDTVDAGDGDDFIWGDDDTLAEIDHGADVLAGGAGNDYVRGYGGDDRIFGGAGFDQLLGEAGADTLEGGAGGDTLLGGSGNDVYRIYRGDGPDVITDADATPGNVDRLVYAVDILATQVRPTRSGNNLVLILTGTADQVTVTNYFENEGAGSSLLEQIEFLADGTVWDFETVTYLLTAGTDGPDSIVGSDADELLSGLGGNDTLIGNGGNDTLDGGAGNDNLQGGMGNDLYLVTREGGADVLTEAGDEDALRFSSDIMPSEVSIARGGDSLALSVNGANSQVTILNYFTGGGVGATFVERIEFPSTGSVWDFNTVSQLLPSGNGAHDIIIGTSADDLLNGYAGNDILNGGAGNDTLIGGVGRDELRGDEGDDVLDGRGALIAGAADADILHGGAGDDIYLFGRLSGADEIRDLGDIASSPLDVVLFGADIQIGHVTVRRESFDRLSVTVAGMADGLIIDGYFVDDGAGPDTIEELRFADSTVWDVATIKAKVLVATPNGGTLIGYATDDTILGIEGPNMIYGRAGNDTLRGGPGFDALIGEGGSDTYLYSHGFDEDLIWNGPGDSIGSLDVLLLTDIVPSQVMVSRETSDYDDLILTIPLTAGQVKLRDYFAGDLNVVEQIRFANGTIWTEQTIAGFFPISGTSGNDTLLGNGLSNNISGLAGSDYISGAGGNDTLDGGLGSDTLHGDGGDDLLIAGAGDAKNASIFNLLYGGDGNDVLVASGKTDTLYGETGNDILLGGSGVDWLHGGSGNNLYSGAANADSFVLDTGNDFAIGGAGADTIYGDLYGNGIRGHDVVAFNKSDGQDSAMLLGDGSTISIGGGTRYSNLSLEVQGTTLRLKTGSSHHISLADWYGSPAAAKAVTTLQVVIDGTRDYNASSPDPMKNKKIQAFDFLGLVAAFDAARAAGQNFNVAGNLADFRLWSSDTDAIGGAVAYQYASTGSISALSYEQMRAVISDPAFGVSPQAISTSSTAASMPGSGTDAVSLEASIAAVSLDASALSDKDAAAAFGATSESAASVEAGLLYDVSGAEQGARTDPQQAIDALASPPFVLPPPIQAPAEIAGRHSLAGNRGVLEGAGVPASTAGNPQPEAGVPTSSSVTVGNNLDDTRETAAMSITSGAPAIAADALLDRVVGQWFAGTSSYDDLTPLDEIGEWTEYVPEAGAVSVAATWEASHRWLTRHAGAQRAYGDPGTGGADLSGLSPLGTNNAYYDMPRSAVGLHDVSGHRLQAFEGLQDGMRVLAQT